MNSIYINTSQNVNLAFPIASIGDRIVAFAIDSIIKIAYLIVLIFLIEKIIGISYLLDEFNLWELNAFVGIITLPTTLYTLFFETMMEGQTPGKKIMKCRVVKIDGYQAEFIDYLTRWIFRIIDILFSSGFIGIISIVINKNGQRLGGIASRTAVVSLKQYTFLSQTLFSEIEQDYTPNFPQVRALSDDDMRIIIKNYQEAIDKKRFEIINKLAEKIREITGIPNQNPEINNRDFIKKIIEDFNHYTREK